MIFDHSMPNFQSCIKSRDLKCILEFVQSDLKARGDVHLIDLYPNPPECPSSDMVQSRSNVAGRARIVGTRERKHV